MKLLPILTLCLCAWATVAGAQEAKSPRQLAHAADTAMEKKDYAGAISGYRAALAGGYHPAVVLYALADAYAEQGYPEQALATLERAVGEGMQLSDWLESDDSLAPLRGNPRWPAIVDKAKQNEQAYRSAHANPDSFKFLTGDIDLFWRVYDKLPAAPHPGDVLDNQYLDQGSVALQGFVRSRIGSGEQLYQTLSKRAKYYAAIRPATLQAGHVEPTVRRAMRRFKTMYDPAMFPDVYLLIGAMNSGGTSSPEGLLIGTELFSMGPGVPTDELSAWQKTVVKSSDRLPSIITHELMHFQQRIDPRTLLGHAIKEGTADFLASLVVDGNFNEQIYAYGYAHEAELKKEFFAKMDGSDLTGWLYGGEAGERPGDLGYFMGFRICQAYYQQAKDKKQAVADMLNIKDFKRFLADSGYAGAQRN